MNYEEFIIEVLKKISAELGEEYEIICKDIVKNNSCVFKCLYIMNKCVDENMKMTPAIYLEYWFDRYQHGESIESIVAKLIMVYYESVNIADSFDLTNISKDRLKECIFYRLVNYEANKEQLYDVPYIPFLDLALTFHYRCKQSDNSVNSFRINDKLMKMWGLCVDDLFDYAEQNMPVMFPDVFATLSNVMRKYIPCSCDELDFSENIFVLTNNYGINGATAMLYTTKLHKLADFLDDDLYIIPSSIHEIIIIPVNEANDGEIIKSLINEVNYSQVLPEERLSDNLYIFRKETKIVEIY